MEKVIWGVLSTARIGTQKVIPAMQRSPYCEIRAIASRSLETAQQAARAVGIPRAYGSYEQLLEDDEIQAVYNPLPNHLHVPWTLKALEAGKHVLCEKPIALDAAEAQQLVDAARRFPYLVVMEAFMYRFHPQWLKAKQLVEEGEIGDLRAIDTVFSYYNDNPSDVRNQAEIGGGGLLDIGCYPISLSRWLFQAEPQGVRAWMEIDPRFGIDRLTSAILEFPRGVATFTVSTQLFPYQRVQIFGTSGRIEIEIPFNPPNDRPCRVWLKNAQRSEEIHIPTCDHFRLQGEAFSKAVLEKKPAPTPLEDALANMRVIDAVKAAATG
ncbi:MAG: Gfo/Idh/MocA family protein [Chloroflexota bacterium]